MSEEITKENEAVTGEVIRLPLWKACVETMMAQGFTYETSWPVEFFEDKLKLKSNCVRFHMDMMQIIRFVEDETGYCIGQCDNGRTYQIPDAPGHEDVAQRRDRAVKTNARRALVGRQMLLNNPEANLSPEERKKVEDNSEKAARRYLLLRHEKKAISALEQLAPKLLSNRYA